MAQSRSNKVFNPSRYHLYRNFKKNFIFSSTNGFNCVNSHKNSIVWAGLQVFILADYHHPCFLSINTGDMEKGIITL